MRHFLFEEKEYQFKASFKHRIIRDPAAELARVMKRKAVRTGRERHVDIRQNCIVKLQYSNSLDAHKVQLEKYLSREGTGIDGSAALLFGTDPEEYRNNITDRNFRIFLSPQSPNADLKTLAEQFVKRLEKQTGYRLYWQGACHYNTAHPHSHLLINGIDQNGRELRFSKDIVRTFMRETARDLCTVQLGERTARELEMDRERELTASRYTRVDRLIKGLCNPGGRIYPERAGSEKKRVLARLETLRKMGLCLYANGYLMNKNWDDDLKANGRYNAFLNAREDLRYSDKSTLQVYTGSMGEITGKVTKVYRLDDDASDNHAIVLEGLDGKAYFVPLFRKPELRDKDKTAALKEGDLISLRTTANQLDLAGGYAGTEPVNLVNGARYRGDTLLQLQEFQRQNKFPTAEFVTQDDILKSGISIRTGECGIGISVGRKTQETGEWDHTTVTLFNIAQSAKPEKLKKWAAKQMEEHRREHRGRLTPVMIKREDWQVRREITERGFTGNLAAETMQKNRGIVHSVKIRKRV
jgi:hypothetical protein